MSYSLSDSGPPALCRFENDHSDLCANNTAAHCQTYLFSPNALTNHVPMKILFTLIALTLRPLLSPAGTFTVDAGHSTGKVSPILYGLMTEEINHSYDGGLYAELIQNRAFLDNSNSPVHWFAVTNGGATATIALDPSNTFNDQLTASLRLEVAGASAKQAAGVANSGY